MSSEAPIGIFDSGLGGLTVVRAIRARLPGESLIYLGDNARVPYGTRSPQTVMAYARACAAHLVQHQVKFLVVACNTVSAVALPMLAAELGLPVLGVIEPGARAGVLASRNGRVGVLATAGTVASGAYARAIDAADSHTETFMQAAPLWVPLAEDGWLEGTVPELVSERYLQPVISFGVDALVLGCTHYPLLQPVIESVTKRLTPRPVRVVDSALAVADELATCLADRELLASSERLTRSGALQLLVTDMPGRFREVAARFMGSALDNVPIEQVDL